MPRPDVDAFRVEFAELSDQGMRRANNQDSVAAVCGSAARRAHFFMVADGMGAHAAGELASRLAVDSIPHAFFKRTDSEPQVALRQAIYKANQLIHSKGQSSPEFHGMGTTCTCLVLCSQSALVAHVGDSRAYRIRQGRLEQLTFDHSLVWEMAAASHTTADKIPACIPKNVITRSLGPHPTVNVDLEGPHKLSAGDVFLLCSDGLTAVVDDELIGAIAAAMPPEEAVRTLVDIANLRGGPDNISVVVAKVDDPAADSAAGAAAASEGARPRVHPLLWVAIALFLLGAIAFGATGYPIPAILCAGACGAAFAGAAFQRRGSEPSQIEEPHGGPYGNGPYRDLDCRLGKSAAAAVGRVVDELASLESENGPDQLRVDWDAFHRRRNEATEAFDRGDHRTSLRRAAAAICDVMRQVREQRMSDSRVV